MKNENRGKRIGVWNSAEGGSSDKVCVDRWLCTSCGLGPISIRVGASRTLLCSRRDVGAMCTGVLSQAADRKLLITLGRLVRPCRLLPLLRLAGPPLKHQVHGDCVQGRGKGEGGCVA